MFIICFCFLPGERACAVTEIKLCVYDVFNGVFNVLLRCVVLKLCCLIEFVRSLRFHNDYVLFANCAFAVCWTSCTAV